MTKRRGKREGISDLKNQLYDGSPRLLMISFYLFIYLMRTVSIIIDID
jgi:hypothetical protein